MQLTISTLTRLLISRNTSLAGGQCNLKVQTIDPAATVVTPPLREVNATNIGDVYTTKNMVVTPPLREVNATEDLIASFANEEES